MSLQSIPSTRLPGAVRTLIEERLTRDLQLPILPDTAMQVTELANDESADAAQLAELLQRDQSLAGHVLRIANSAAYGAVEPIVSLQHAISRLGLAAIAEIVVAVALKGRVFNVPGYRVKIRSMWMHSAAAAVFAKEIARLLRNNVDSAFMCGLLHDVGKPLVMQILIDAARERTRTPVPAGIVEAAMDEFHERVGAMMAERWSLPSWMGDAIANHHHYANATEHPDATMVTCLADVLANWALDETASIEDFPRDHPVLKDLNVYAEDLEQLLGLRGSVLEVAEAFL